MVDESTVQSKKLSKSENIKVTVNVIPGGWPLLTLLIFIFLKLNNHVDWNWWLVTLPAWGVVAGGVLVEILRVLLKKTD